MKSILDIDEYKNQIMEYANCNIDWNFFNNSNFLITGATGMIGKCLIDLLMYKNKCNSLNCKIIALGRNKEKAKNRLGEYFDDDNFIFIESDINKDIDINVDKVDYLLHAASSTHPLQYSTEPIKTITANVIGTYNLLSFAALKNIKRCLFTSSVEVYGQNRGDIKKFNEDYLGYINCNTLRAGYPESKRTGEALCQAFIKEKNLDIVIARLSRVFGPTMLDSDSKASAQFIKNSINKEDIVLKSNGLQEYSYSYVFDIVYGILLCMTKGKCGEAYNIANNKFDIMLKDFARICAKNADMEVVFDIPSEEESKGFSNSINGLMDSSKINALGYEAKYDIETRIDDTIRILKKMK